nr:DUF1835 domain-containing protein [uncultured Carboxylicivirga sp.]
MSQQYHILNGDALKHQFPDAIKGKLIVARECLVDGSVEGENLSELYETRARFISQNYEGFEISEYYEKTVTEFTKIQNIPSHSEINLWFEEDLFCQINLWFVINLIYTSYNNQTIYLIRPKAHFEYNFGGMNNEELLNAYSNKTRIEFSELKELSRLWALYQKNGCDEMMSIAQKLDHKFPFLKKAINAHIDRLPQNGSPGRPVKTLIQIMDGLQTEDFNTIFREFNRREAIYGLGDLQVKRIMNDIISNRL